MARQKSENRRQAIMQAATCLFAERGAEAVSTSEISKKARVAEGTLFTYFQTKVDLINAVYRDVRTELEAEMMQNFPRDKKFRRKLRHLWNGYFRWHTTFPDRQKVLLQLERTNVLTPDARLAGGGTPFAEIETMATEAGEAEIIRRSIPQGFVAEAFRALAVTTVEFAVKHPDQADDIRDAGFKLLWSGIVRR